MRIVPTIAVLSLLFFAGHARAQPLPPEQIFAAPVAFEAQLAAAGPGEIVLINTFRVAPGQDAAFLQGWSQAAAALARHPGLIRATMHQGVGGSPLWVNVATWSSAAELRAALADPAFMQAARGIGAPFHRQLFTVAAAR